jgi:TetR/AcrR family transcriptional regulator, transcriptional repressor for nem operon
LHFLGLTLDEAAESLPSAIRPFSPTSSRGLRASIVRRNLIARQPRTFSFSNLNFRDGRSNIRRMDIQSTPRRRGRPRKELAGYSETRESLLRAGVAVLTEKGFSSAGIEEILRDANVPKGSFYHFFASKEAFGMELIDRYAAYFARKLDRFLTNESRSPLERLRDFVADAEAGMRRYGFKRGCLVGNLGQEMGVLPEGYRERLRRVLEDWEGRTAHCLRQAQAAGEIAREIDCASVATFFWIGWEGAVLRAKLDGGPAALRTFANGFFAALT